MRLLGTVLVALSLVFFSLCSSVGVSGRFFVAFGQCEDYSLGFQCDKPQYASPERRANPGNYQTPIVRITEGPLWLHNDGKLFTMGSSKGDRGMGGTTRVIDVPNRIKYPAHPGDDTSFSDMQCARNSTGFLHCLVETDTQAYMTFGGALPVGLANRGYAEDMVPWPSIQYFKQADYISTGDHHTLACIYDADSRVARLFGAGSNLKGQLGPSVGDVAEHDTDLKAFASVVAKDGSTVNLSTDACVQSIAVGDASFIYVSSRRLFAMGDNINGQLGVGSVDPTINILHEVQLDLASKEVPVRLQGGTGYVLIHTSADRVLLTGSMMGLKVTGVGDATPIPVDITSTLTDGKSRVLHICGGPTHFAALTSARDMFLVGRNDHGQLGSGRVDPTGYHTSRLSGTAIQSVMGDCYITANATFVYPSNSFTLHDHGELTISRSSDRYLGVSIVHVASHGEDPAPWASSLSYPAGSWTAHLTAFDDTMIYPAGSHVVDFYEQRPDLMVQRHSLAFNLPAPLSGGVTGPSEIRFMQGPDGTIGPVLVVQAHTVCPSIIHSDCLTSMPQGFRVSRAIESTKGNGAVECLAVQPAGPPSGPEKYVQWKPFDMPSVFLDYEPTSCSITVHMTEEQATTTDVTIDLVHEAFLSPRDTLIRPAPAIFADRVSIFCLLNVEGVSPVLWTLLQAGQTNMAYVNAQGQTITPAEPALAEVSAVCARIYSISPQHPIVTMTIKEHVTTPISKQFRVWPTLYFMSLTPPECIAHDALGIITLEGAFLHLLDEAEVGPGDVYTVFVDVCGDYYGPHYTRNNDTSLTVNLNPYSINTDAYHNGCPVRIGITSTHTLKEQIAYGNRTDDLTSRTVFHVCPYPTLKERYWAMVEVPLLFAVVCIGLCLCGQCLLCTILCGWCTSTIALYNRVRMSRRSRRVLLNEFKRMGADTSNKIYKTLSAVYISPDLVTETEYIASGGQGEIRRAVFKDRVVCVKKLHETLNRDTRSLEEFAREGVTLRGLKHPNIMQFIGATFHPPHIVLIVEFCDFGSLDRYMAQRTLHGNPLNWSERIDLIVGAAEGLAYIHAKGLLHRDIKPENILLGVKKGQPIAKIADLGLVTKMKMKHRDQTVTTIGTPVFAPPEVNEGGPYDAKADVYGFGMTMWCVAHNGKIPFEDVPHAITVAQKVARGERPPIDADVPVWLSDLIVDCWDQKAFCRPYMRQVVERLKKGPAAVPIRDDQMNFPLLAKGHTEINS